MSESSRDTTTSRRQQRIEFRDDTFVVDAVLVGELLRLPPSRVQMLMRSGKITSACERGLDEHAGEFRFSFFYRNRRARVCTDLEGRILRVGHRFRRPSDSGRATQPIMASGLMSKEREDVTWPRPPADHCDLASSGVESALIFSG